MTNTKLKFQKMWEAHPMGTLGGEDVVNFNFSNDPKFKEKTGLIEKNTIFYYEKDIGTQFYYEENEMKKAAEFGFIRFTNKKKDNRTF